MSKLIEHLGAGLYLLIIGVPISITTLIVNFIFFPSLKFIIVNPTFNTIIGLTLLVIGILIWIYSVKQISKFVKNEKLFTKGLYNYIRHPLYAAILLFLIPSLILLLRALLGLFIIPAFFLIFHFSIRKEEKQLIQKFGQEYIDYSKKTKRLIPKIY
ncbi:MAG: methyltransferase family protein [Candidatus Helarchaeota archaeon]